MNYKELKCKCLVFIKQIKINILDLSFLLFLGHISEHFYLQCFILTILSNHVKKENSYKRVIFYGERLTT